MSFRTPDGGRFNHGRPRQQFPSRDMRNKRPMSHNEINRTWTGTSSRVANRAYPREFDLGLPGNSIHTKPSGIRMLDGRVETVPPPLPDGSVGGRFSSTMNFRAVNHSAMRGCASRRGTRLQPIYVQRWVALPPEPEELNVTNHASTMPLTFMSKTRPFDNSWNAPDTFIPSVSQSSYLMTGQRITPRSKRNMEQEELQQFQKMGLKPAPELFFGRGFGAQAKTVRVRSLSQQFTPGQVGVDRLEINHDNDNNDDDDPSLTDSGNVETIAEEVETSDGPLSNEQDQFADARLQQDGDDLSELDYMNEKEPLDTLSESMSGLAGWEGTVMDSSLNAGEGDDRKNVLSLLRGVDDQPQSLDVATYTLRELYGSAEDDVIQRLSQQFMLVDETGVGKITVEALQTDIESNFSSTTWDLVSNVLNVSGGHSIALREYITAVHVAEQVCLPTFAGSISGADIERWRPLSEAFFAADLNKTGLITVQTLRKLIPDVLEEQLQAALDSTTLMDHASIRLFDVLLMFPRLI